MSLLDMRIASFNSVTTYDSEFYYVNKEVKVIVKDDEDNYTKTWAQDKLGTGNGTILTVSELSQ